MERRNTIQKQLVLEAVARLHNHPTAEQVYAKVVKEHPTISKATVYRNLASLSEDGRLRHLPMPAGADRFDHRLDEHAHIECMACGRLDDVEFSAGAPGSELASLDAFAEQATGYTDDVGFAARSRTWALLRAAHSRSRPQIPSARAAQSVILRRNAQNKAPGPAGGRFARRCAPAPGKFILKMKEKERWS